MSYVRKPFVRIANTQGFWGDRPTASAQLIQQLPDIDYLTLDYLAEVSLSIMAIQREKNPQEGYAKDFIETLNSLFPFWKAGKGFKVVTNAGGLNPLACAKKCRELLNQSGLHHLKIGVVYGDDVLPSFKAEAANPIFNHLETNESLNTIEACLITANVYLGASSIVELLNKGADVIITGRVADPSLTVGPCIAYHHWDFSEYDKIAQATVAGHLIECGTQVTGGITTDWLDNFISIKDAARYGFPYVDVYSDGAFCISKSEESGGRVDERTVKEQLLYEIGDPSSYLSPDVTVSFLDLRLNEIKKNRLQILGAKGRPPTDTYKVSATYTDGYKAEAFLGIFGPEAVKKAQLCGEIIFQRVADEGYQLERTRIECLGAGDIVSGVFPNEKSMSLECVLRVAAADLRYEALECFAREVAPLVTSGPQGVTGYASGRPHIRQIFGYWPCLIEKSKVIVITEML